MQTLDELSFSESDVRVALGHGAGAEPAYDFATTQGPGFTDSPVFTIVEDGNGGGGAAAAAAAAVAVRAGGGGSTDGIVNSSEGEYDIAGDLIRQNLEAAGASNDSDDTAPPARPPKDGKAGRKGKGKGKGKTEERATMQLFQTMKLKPKPKKRMPPPKSGAASPFAPSDGGGGSGRRKQPSVMLKPDIGGDEYSSSSDARGGGGQERPTLPKSADDWRFARTETGKIYYINIKTQATSWTLPPGCEPMHGDEA